MDVIFISVEASLRVALTPSVPFYKATIAAIEGATVLK
jgi:hypothetical protein